jgi:AAA domain
MNISTATFSPNPILAIHGPPGVGKSTTVSKAARPVAILVERGLPLGCSIDAFDDIDTFEGVMAALKHLYNDRGEYLTLVIETLDKIEELAVQHVCRSNGWKSIEQPSFGKGYVSLDQEWRRFLRGLVAVRDKHRMLVLLTCHSEINTISDPRAPSYTSYQLRLHKRIRGPTMDVCDAVFFMNEDLHVVTSGEGFRERTLARASPQRFLFTEGKPAYAAKHRFGAAMPGKIAIPVDFKFPDLARYWDQNNAQEAQPT